MNFHYETPRLNMRVLYEEQASLVCDYYIRNKAFLKEWDPARTDAFYAVEYHQEQLMNEVKNIKSNAMLRLWLFSKTQEDKVIGMISFSNIVRGVFLSCHLGYSLDEAYINQGYMTEALKRGIDIIFKEYKLHRIEANIMPRNLPSRAVLEKLGFREEGLAKEYLKINGKWEDHIHMVLLNDLV
ncbi:MAG: GNAT family N-acetyltransferase [Anaerocolumna sp.]